jgi:hypothetical protein
VIWGLSTERRVKSLKLLFITSYWLPIIDHRLLVTGYHQRELQIYTMNNYYKLNI